MDITVTTTNFNAMAFTTNVVSVGIVISYLIDLITRKRKRSDETKKGGESLNDELTKCWRTPQPTIRSFSGKNKEWAKWRRTNQSKLGGLGFDPIIADRSIADKNPIKNRQLYSILEDATCDGCITHIIHKFEKTHDGHEAWKAMVKHFGGDLKSCATLASASYDKLRKTKLVPGIIPSDFISDFQLLYDEIQSLEGFEMNPHMGKQQFIDNIDHPDYDVFKEQLEHHIEKQTLESMIEDLYKKEAVLEKQTDKDGGRAYKKRRIGAGKSYISTSRRLEDWEEI